LSGSPLSSRRTSSTRVARTLTLLELLKHLTRSAGNASLMTPELMRTLADHAMGNYRALTNMAAELLAVAAQRELTQLDEKLYLDVFAPPSQTTAKRRERLPSN